MNAVVVIWWPKKNKKVGFFFCRYDKSADSRICEVKVKIGRWQKKKQQNQNRPHNLFMNNIDGYVFFLFSFP